MSTKVAPSRSCSCLAASPPALHPGSGRFAHDPGYFAAQMDVSRFRVVIGRILPAVGHLVDAARALVLTLASRMALPILCRHGFGSAVRLQTICWCNRALVGRWR
jgi:hypothetical protein